jgi:hypothetical protein
VLDFHSLQRPYLQHLAKLVLDEDASPQLFRTAPQLYAIYLGVSEKVWEKSAFLNNVHQTIDHVIESYCRCSLHYHGAGNQESGCPPAARATCL